MVKNKKISNDKVKGAANKKKSNDIACKLWVKRVDNCSMFCCTLLYAHSSIAIILMGKKELVALLYLSSWCLVMVERLFLAMPRGCQQFVIVVFPDHTHLLFWFIWRGTDS